MPLVDRYLALAVEEKDVAAVEHFGRRMVSMAVELRQHGETARRAMLALGRGLSLTAADEPELVPLREPILNAMGRIYVYFPDDVVDVLLTEMSLLAWENTVRLRTTPETLGDITAGRISWFVRYNFLSDPSPGQPRLKMIVRLLHAANETKNLPSWLRLLLQEIMHLIPPATEGKKQITRTVRDEE